MTGFDRDDGLDGVPRQSAEAAAALEGLKRPAEAAASSIEQAFDRAGTSLARSLGRAAADGKVTMAELAQAVLAAVNGAAGAKGGGLGDVLAGAFAAVAKGFSGARAEGGPRAGRSVPAAPIWSASGDRSCSGRPPAARSNRRAGAA